MADTRPEAAEAAAYRELEAQLPQATELVHLREFCALRVRWILQGGDRPAGLTEFTRAVTIRAVNKGLEHAFGDAHSQEIDPAILRRRDSD